MNIQRLLRVLVLWSVALLTVIPVSSAVARAEDGDSDPMTQSLQPLKGSEFASSFLKQMIQHYRSGIEMTKLVHTHTKRTELHKFADKMIPTQE